MNFYQSLFIIFLSLIFIYLIYRFYIFITTDFRYQLCKFKPFPQKYRSFLRQRFPIYKRLPPDIKRNLHACIMVFIKEKEFIGVKGIVIDDMKKVLVAANACLLTAGIDRCMYKDVKTVILYPEAFVKKEKIINGWVISEEESALLGEAWQSGQVVISYKDLTDGDINPNDGKNVGLHEFAHQLDMADGFADGTPLLPFSLYGRWRRIMSKEFKKIEEIYADYRGSFLDSYAITSPAEFFAVATENFFEKPEKMKKELPELYTLLKEFYRLDPVKWKEA
ncbi:zinc-dependent peptidase [Nitrosophilus alvini]|uniref:M90 family metallopeptidase n=1 Tax=Nitrosophilus alvini TaxID=2714855 RepID=UPI0022789D0B|nr:M90 family metallopeptidase [Nitrosophilus alvini]